MFINLNVLERILETSSFVSFDMHCPRHRKASFLYVDVDGLYLNKEMNKHI